MDGSVGGAAAPVGADPAGLAALDAGRSCGEGIAPARAASTRRARSDGPLMAPRSVEPGDPDPGDPDPGDPDPDPDTGPPPAAGAAAAPPEEDQGEPLLRADTPSAGEVPDERAAPEGGWLAELAVGAGEPDEIWDNPKPDAASTAAAARTHDHGRPFPAGSLAGPLAGSRAGLLAHGRRVGAAPLARPPEAPTTPSSKRSRAACTAAALAPGRGSSRPPTRCDTACQRAHREAQSGHVAR